MKKSLLICIAIAALAAAGMAWLVNTPLKPPVQKVEQAIPDARIPR